MILSTRHEEQTLKILHLSTSGKGWLDGSAPETIFARAHTAATRTLHQPETPAIMGPHGCKVYGKITEKFCNALSMKTFVHIDIVEVTDSSSVTPTIEKFSGIRSTEIESHFSFVTFPYRATSYDFSQFPAENETEKRFFSKNGVFRIVSGQILCSWRSRDNYACQLY